MYDTIVTLQGWLGSAPTVRRAGEAPVARFRLACTPRHYQREAGAWVDGDVQWYDVSAWRRLGEHCARSLRRGDPVVVHGRLIPRSYVDSEGQSRTSLDVEALTVGHDLTWGTAEFRRAARPGEAEAEAAEPSGSTESSGSPESPEHTESTELSASTEPVPSTEPTRLAESAA